MRRAGFSLSGWGRRRIILLLFIQLLAVGMVISLLQSLPSDRIWFPSTNGDFGNAGELRRLNERHTESTTNQKGHRDDGEAKDGGAKSVDDVFNFIPYYNNLSRILHAKNLAPPQNQDLYPKLRDDHVPIVLYVHNRPQYLQLVVESLSKVKGIEETLLVVSHDGFFPEMNAIVESIKFCQVKQIFAVFSPHLFPDSFPGQALNDCKGKDDAAATGCTGEPDQYGNHREPRIVSLKHHWWWMMNTIWDGLGETRNTMDHILFIEEDHYLLPNAYRTIQQLSKIVVTKCPECVAVNLAPVDVTFAGERFEQLVVEKIGNMGYAFNRTVWNWIHAQSKAFCAFDEYNWDITMWVVVYPSFPTEGSYTLRSSKTSAVHFGKCGLHQGQDKGKSLCIDDENKQLPSASEEDMVPFINAEWKTTKYPMRGYKPGFTGWGGWGDSRDQKLCSDFSQLYHRVLAS